jgi:hypothetical protein
LRISFTSGAEQDAEVDSFGKNIIALNVTSAAAKKEAILSHKLLAGSLQMHVNLHIR